MTFEHGVYDDKASIMIILESLYGFQSMAMTTALLVVVVFTVAKSAIARLGLVLSGLPDRNRPDRCAGCGWLG